MKRMFALAGLAALLSSPADAADRGFYFGFDLGQYAYDIDQRGLDRDLVDALGEIGLDVVDGRSETSEDGFTYGITFGYQILRFLAVEAQYVDLGDAEYKASMVATDGLGTANVDAQFTAESSGPAVSVLGILPLMHGWEVYGRAGVYFANSDASGRLSLDGFSERVADSSNTQEFLWGAGVGYSSGDWTVRLDYQQYTDVGDDDTFGDVSVDRIVLGAVYRY